jgi:hypothetical protein
MFGIVCHDDTPFPSARCVRQALADATSARAAAGWLEK